MKDLMRIIKSKTSAFRLLTILFSLLFIVACSDDSFNENASADSGVAKDPVKGKEVAGMTVVESSIILNKEAVSLLKEATKEELLFTDRPVQADSMQVNYIITSGIIPDKAPNGLLYKVVETPYKDAQGYHVKVKEAEITDYILYAEINGSVSLSDVQQYQVYSSEEPNISLFDKKSGFRLPTAEGISNVETFRVIGGKTLELNPVIPIYKTGSVKFNILFTPTIDYTISINPFKGLQIDLKGDFTLNQLKSILDVKQGLGPVKLGGSNYYIPFLVIPIGPVVITPFVSITPYVEGKIGAELLMSMEVSGNINAEVHAGFKKNGVAGGATAIVNKPVMDKLNVPVDLETGIQATIGIGAYGKTLFAEIENKLGAKTNSYVDVVNRKLILEVKIPVKSTAAAGANLLFFNTWKYEYTILNKNLYSNEWEYKF